MSYRVSRRFCTDFARIADYERDAILQDWRGQARRLIVRDRKLERGVLERWRRCGARDQRQAMPVCADSGVWVAMTAAAALAWVSGSRA